MSCCTLKLSTFYITSHSARNAKEDFQLMEEFTSWVTDTELSMVNFWYNKSLRLWNVGFSSNGFFMSYSTLKSMSTFLYNKSQRLWNVGLSTNGLFTSYSILKWSTVYTGWPRKNATLTINNFKKTRDRMKKLCALLRIKSHFFQQDDTKIVNFDEGVLILEPFFWGNVIFQNLHLLYQKSRLR